MSKAEVLIKELNCTEGVNFTVINDKYVELEIQRRRVYILADEFLIVGNVPEFYKAFLNLPGIRGLLQTYSYYLFTQTTVGKELI